MYNKNFGKELAKLRREAGFESQRQFALAVGLSAPSVSRIESGLQQVEPETLQKMAPYLKVTYEALMTVAGYLAPQRASQKSSGAPGEDDLPGDWMEGLSFIRRAGSTLDDNEKQILLALGREFVRQVEEGRKRASAPNEAAAPDGRETP